MRFAALAALVLLPGATDTELLGLGAAAAGAPLPPEWSVRAVRGQQPPATRIVDSAGTRFLRIEGRGRAAWIGRRVALPPARGAMLQWRWRIVQAPAGADLRTEATDDAAARIFVAFDTRTFLGRPPKTLFYTSGGAEPDGYARASFASRNLHVIRIAVPAGGAWGEVRVDPLADYARIFGEAPPRIVGIGVLQDTEQTGGAAIADVASLTWRVP